MTPQPRYLTIEELLAKIQEPERSICQRILTENRELFEATTGSSHNHQVWPGGYLDHVTETMNLACVFFPIFDALRPLPFSLSDALLVLFLHDIEKPWRFELGEGGQLYTRADMTTKEEREAFRNTKFTEYGLTFTEAQRNALKYVEGEHKDYSGERRVSNELSNFCHVWDTSSARIWPGHPIAYNDPWKGARRIRS